MNATADTAVRRGAGLPAGRAPVAGGAVPWLGVVIAVVVIGVGVTLLHDALHAMGLVGGPWLANTVSWLEALRPMPWMLPVALLFAVVGIWVAVVAVRPRRRTGVTLRARTGVFLSLRDVRRVAVAAAQDVDGVTMARAGASRRRIVVDVRATSASTQVRDDVAVAVADRLSALDPTPSVSVRVRTAGGPR